MQRAAFAAGVFTAVLGGLVLVGWSLHVVALQRLLPGLATMKANTALSLCACGVALAVRARPRRRRWLDRAAIGLAIAAAVSAAAVGAEWATGIDLRVDQALFADPMTPVDLHPGRMSPGTAAAVACVGGALATLDGVAGVSQLLGVAAAAASLLALLGYAYGIDALYRVSLYRSMALHTAVALAVVSGGALMARPLRCLPALLTRRSDGGRMARRLLPGVAVVPLALGWACCGGDRAGWYDAPFGFALFALASIGVLAALVWVDATATDRVDAVRRRVQADRDRLLVREQLARATAERALAARDQLLSLVSHELRTPLTPVLLIATDLAARADLPAEVTRDLVVVREQVGVEVRLIDDLLDLVRLRQGKLSLDCRPVPVGAVVGDVARLFARTFAERRVALDVVLPGTASDRPGPDDRTARVDPDRLGQVVRILLSNALKFTPAGGRVTVGWGEAAAGWVAVDVRDDGVGMAAEVLGRIFAEFEQADASTTRRFGGLGLGLAIGRQLAVMHGGTLTVASDGPGRGSTFTLRLPTVPAAVGPPEAATGAPTPTAIAHDPADASPPAGLTILLVDDDRQTLQALAKLLDRLGHRVTTAASAAEALAAMAGRPAMTFDVLVSDLGLPDVSGWDLMRQARDRSPSLAGIAMSGFVADADRARSRDSGFAVHLAKPLDLPRLTAALATVVTARRG